MNEILNTAKNVLELEGAELIAASHQISAEFQKATEIIFATKGKVIVTGVGKSGHIGAKIAATLASTGTPAFFIHPTEAMHGDLGMLQKNDIVLAISFSGETRELAEILPHIKRYGNKIVSMTQNLVSTLAKFSDAIIQTNVQKEACDIVAAPTTSSTLTLALGDALAICLMKMRNFKADDFANFHPGGTLGKRLFLKVKDIMRCENLPVESENISLRKAIDAMTHAKLGSVLFVDKNGALMAILSDGDLRRALMRDDFDINDRAINYATKSPKTLQNAEILAFDALKIIEEHKIQLLVVVDENLRPVGVLHIHDLTKLGL